MVKALSSLRDAGVAGEAGERAVVVSASGMGRSCAMVVSVLGTAVQVARVSTNG